MQAGHGGAQFIESCKQHSPVALLTRVLFVLNELAVDHLDDRVLWGLPTVDLLDRAGRQAHG